MRIKHLQIKQFKNLTDFELDLRDNTQNILITVGQNGTGKSNLLEAVVLIFRNLYIYETKGIRYIQDIMKKTKTSLFEFKIEYECNGKIVRVEFGKESDETQTSLLFEDIDESNYIDTYTFTFFMKEGNRFKKETKANFYAKDSLQSNKYLHLPMYVFAYYSGISNRLETHFDYHQKKFYDDLKNGENRPFRPLFYARPIHSNFVLMAFYAFQDDVTKRFLEKYLGIKGLKSSLFVIREPEWKSNEGDIRFWKAKGVVAEFLDNLFSKSFMPIKHKIEIKTDFRRSAKLVDCWYLYLDSQAKLQALATEYCDSKGIAEQDRNVEFFKALESTYISDLIHETRIRVEKEGGGSITFKELSEGEQQLLTVIGLLKFTNNAESLFLLDEPDTHLSPIWGHEYLGVLKSISGEYNNSQMFLSTHKAMTVSGLEKEQVLIFEKNEGKTTVNYPDVSPQGLSADGVLTQIFKMAYTYSQADYTKMVERRRLFAKKEFDKSNFTPDDANQLQELTIELNGYSENYGDGLFYAFVHELDKLNKLDAFKEVVFTDDEREQRYKEAREILEKLRKQKK